MPGKWSVDPERVRFIKDYFLRLGPAALPVVEVKSFPETKEIGATDFPFFENSPPGRGSLGIHTICYG